MTNHQEQICDELGEVVGCWMEEALGSGVDPSVVAVLILDLALELHFSCLGTEKALKAVDLVIRHKIRKYSDDEAGLERN